MRFVIVPKLKKTKQTTPKEWISNKKKAFTGKNLNSIAIKLTIETEVVAFKRKQIDIYRSQTCFFQFSQSFTAFRHERFCQSPRTLIIEYFDVTSSRHYRQSETTETLIFTSDGGFTFFFSFSLAFIICFWQNSCSKASYFTLMWSCMSKISFQTFSWAALNRYAWFILHGFWQ